ncbi:hypothetical protein CEXT_768661 [Caerostris extrusa]|uniref:Uncharacterized protein n=1 Tax=Caerostris extrusa TaxID=172846 RepID=A0AAV4RVX2_CAEEX|nr:hypothetical protein CEXT_768661 [Caerostris extrusa]
MAIYKVYLKLPKFNLVHERHTGMNSLVRNEPVVQESGVYVSPYWGDHMFGMNSIMNGQQIRRAIPHLKLLPLKITPPLNTSSLIFLLTVELIDSLWVLNLRPESGNSGFPSAM